MKYPKVTENREMTTQEKIVYLIKNNKANTMTDIAIALGRNKSTVSEHLNKLYKQKLLRRKMLNGKVKMYSAKE